MPVTATLVAATPLQLRYLLAEDGEGGSVTITAAQLLADSIAGALHEMPGIGQDIPFNSQDHARWRMLGASDGGVTDPIDMKDHAHAVCTVTPRSGPFATMARVDADTDAVSPLRCELNATMPAGAGFAVLEVAFQHTLNR